MAIDGTATVAGVKPCDEGRDISNEAGAGGGNQCRGASGNRSDDGGGMWNGNNNR